MKLSIILIFMLVGFLIAIFSLYIIATAMLKKRERKNRDKKRHCNCCNYTYLFDSDPIYYCQVCGSELQYQPDKDSPSTEELPFEDFNEKE